MEKRALQTLALCLAIAGGLHAQISPALGAGCLFGPPAPQTSGAPRIGGSLSITCNSPAASVATSLWIGGCSPTPILVPVLVSCQTGCALGIDPSVFIAVPATGTVSLRIPNVRSLVGASFCLQCVESMYYGACIEVSLGWRVTVQP